MTKYSSKVAEYLEAINKAENERPLNIKALEIFNARLPFLSDQLNAKITQVGKATMALASSFQALKVEAVAAKNITKVDFAKALKPTIAAINASIKAQQNPAIKDLLDVLIECKADLPPDLRQFLTEWLKSSNYDGTFALNLDAEIAKAIEAIEKEAGKIGSIVSEEADTLPAKLDSLLKQLKLLRDFQEEAIDHYIALSVNTQNNLHEHYEVCEKLQGLLKENRTLFDTVWMYEKAADKKLTELKKVQGRERDKFLLGLLIGVGATVAIVFYKEINNLPKYLNSFV